MQKNRTPLEETSIKTSDSSTYPQVTISQMWVVSGVGTIDGLFAVNLNYTAVLNVSWVLQLVEDITSLVFDQQSCAGRPEHQYPSKQNSINQKH